MKHLFAFLLLTATASAHPTVTETAILGHGDPVPRFANLLPNRLVVPAEQTVTLPPDSTYDAIEVAGTLRVSREHDTVCRFTHLTILPGGTVDIGTVDDPVSRKVDFVIRDVPLATGTAQEPGIDPYQFGNGIINFGYLTVHGRSLEKTWTTMAEVAGGATTLTLAVPQGWQVGDELLLPDVRQLGVAQIRREAPVSIAAIDGDTVTLNKPLDFEHSAARSPDGELRYLPYVANASRNIVIRSENPQGTRGHIIHLESAHVDVRYAALLGLGRTRAVNIDNTVTNGNAFEKIGTNQIARYAFHWHHVVGHMDHDMVIGRVVGCYLTGDDLGKWGIVDHQTSDCLVTDNVCDRFVGAGIVTEDGPEVRSQFLRNFVMGCKGNGIDGKFNFVPPNFIPGGEGAGFWFHGLEVVVKGNVSINNHVGYQLLYRNQVQGRKVPSEPGAQNDTPYDPTTAIPIAFEDNHAVANTATGHEQWNNPYITTIRRLYCWHNGVFQVFIGNGEPGTFVATDYYALAQGGVSDAIKTSAAYTDGIHVDGGVIEGCAVGIHEARDVRLKNLTMQCAVDLNYYYFRPYKTVLDGVKFKPLPDKPKQYIVYGQGQDWKPGEPFHNFPAPWNVNTGAMFEARNWQGAGADYLLFENQQLRHKPAWPGYHARTGQYLCPEAGLTMGECWDKYGIAYGGGVVDQSEAVPLEGLIHGVGRVGLEPRIGPARAVMVTPGINGRFSEPPAGGRIDFNFYLTGKSPREQNAMFSVDDSPAMGLAYYTNSHGVARLTNVGTAPGKHTVRSWRYGFDSVDNPLPGSEMTFTYYVGVEPEPEPEPEPQPEPTELEKLKAEIASLKAEVTRLQGVIQAVRDAIGE